MPRSLFHIVLIGAMMGSILNAEIDVNVYAKHVRNAIQLILPSFGLETLQEDLKQTYRDDLVCEIYVVCETGSRATHIRFVPSATDKVQSLTYCFFAIGWHFPLLSEVIKITIPLLRGDLTLARQKLDQSITSYPNSPFDDFVPAGVTIQTRILRNTIQLHWEAYKGHDRIAALNHVLAEIKDIYMAAYQNLNTTYIPIRLVITESSQSIITATQILTQAKRCLGKYPLLQYVIDMTYYLLEEKYETAKAYLTVSLGLYPIGFGVLYNYSP